jgi:dTDP-glucose 4,6-dehydratase
VTGLSRSKEPHTAFLPYKWTSHSGNFQFIQADLNKDLEKIMSLVASEKPEFVVNFAAQSMVAESWQNPDHWFMTNVVSNIRLHEQLRHCDFLQKFVQVTTPEVYGNTDGFIKESTPFNPTTPYAVSRAACDMSLKSYVDAYDFPVIFTRAANVYGPGQQLYRIMPRTIMYLLTGKKLQLHGGGVSRRSFIHMEDVSEAMWQIIQRASNGETFHISTNEIITIRGLVEKICGKLGADFTECVDVAEERLGKDAAYMLDSTKLRNEYGWEDRISLDEGLDETIDWVKTNLDELLQQPMNYIHKP